MVVAKLATSLLNTALIGSGAKNLIERNYRASAGQFAAGLTVFYLSSSPALKPDSLGFYASSGIGASSILDLCAGNTTKGLGKLASASAIVSLSLAIFNWEIFSESPEALLVAAPGISLVSGGICLGANYVWQQMLGFLEGAKQITPSEAIRTVAL